jgi:hypothetical protein
VARFEALTLSYKITTKGFAENVGIMPKIIKACGKGVRAP